MRWLVASSVLFATPLLAAPLDFAGIRADRDVRYTPSIHCLNYFGNSDYLCRYSKTSFQGVPIRQSFVSFNKKTFRPTVLTLVLDPKVGNKALLMLVELYGSPAGQAPLKINRGMQKPLDGYATVWSFDGLASAVLTQTSEHLQLRLAFPQNEPLEKP
jgi:hypothetical protein